MTEITNILMNEFDLPYELVRKIFYEHKGLQHPITRMLKGVLDIDTFYGAIRLKKIPKGLRSDYYMLHNYEKQNGSTVTDAITSRIGDEGCKRGECYLRFLKIEVEYCNNCKSLKPYKKKDRYPYGRRCFYGLFGIN